VSTWLQAGVAPPQIAEWAGHSVSVLLRVYAKCITGTQDEAKRRILEATKTEDSSPASEPDGINDYASDELGHVLGTATRIRPPSAAHNRTGQDQPLATFPLVSGRFCWWWQVLGSNQRRLSRRFYRETAASPAARLSAGRIRSERPRRWLAVSSWLRVRPFQA
jgi:hypothetical protein